jgi:hypothetical protein
MQRLTVGSTVRDAGKSPAAGCSVLLSFLHGLNIHGGLGNRRIKAGAGKACQASFWAEKSGAMKSII